MTADPLSYFVALRTVATYLRAHPTEDITLARAAEIAGWERTYFAHFFKRKTGVTFARWKRQQQVEAAVRLLQQSDDPLSVVARRTGFPSVRTLRRAFALYLGKSPARVRPFGGRGRTKVRAEDCDHEQE